VTTCWPSHAAASVKAGQDTLTVDDDRARAARALIAALLRACETERVAKRVQQREARVVRDLVSRVVHTKRRSDEIFGSWG